MLLHKCEVCGDKNASFGDGVNLRLAVSNLEKGNIELAKKNLGRWHCKKHKNKIE